MTFITQKDEEQWIFAAQPETKCERVCSNMCSHACECLWQILEKGECNIYEER